MQRRFADELRLVGYGLALGLVTASVDILAGLGSVALGPVTDGRYAVDIARTLLLYAGLGAAYAACSAALWAIWNRAVPSRPVSASVPTAGLVGVWTFAFTVAARSVHGTALLGTTEAPGIAFFAGAAVIAAAVIQIVWRRSSNARAAGTPTRLGGGVLVLALAAVVPLVLRQTLDLDSLVRRKIAAIPLDSAVAQDPARPDILLLTIDTLRADRVGAYGYAEARTPALDSLAAGGVLFERTIAQSSWTRPSFGTMFTSRYPSDHEAAWRLLSNAPGARRSLFNRPLRSDLPTLAELLDTAGYLTVAINTNVQTSKPFGFDHGFDAFIDISRPLSALTSSLICRETRFRLAGFCARLSVVSPDYPYLTADRVFAVFEKLAPDLDRSAAPYFLWLHLMDPHVPYRIHDGTGRKLGYNEIEAMLSDEKERSAALSTLETYYDAAIAYTDGYVGRVVERLAATERPRPPLTLVTSDHGEEIAERWRAESSRPSGLAYYFRGYGHGHTMYEEVLRVPMILSFPDRSGAGTRVRDAVGHIDITPTLLAAAGVTTANPRYRPEGIDLSSSIARKLETPRPLRSEKTLYGNEVKQLTLGDKKIIDRSADGAEERYDLSADPGERDTLPATPTDGFSAIERMLAAWLAAVPPEPNIENAEDATTLSIEADDALRRQLEALGYVQ